jgi:hypothetical protein
MGRKDNGPSTYWGADRGQFVTNQFAGKRPKRAERVQNRRLPSRNKSK